MHRAIIIIDGRYESAESRWLPRGSLGSPPTLTFGHSRLAQTGWSRSVSRSHAIPQRRRPCEGSHWHAEPPWMRRDVTAIVDHQSHDWRGPDSLRHSLPQTWVGFRLQLLRNQGCMYM